MKRFIISVGFAAGMIFFAAVLVPLLFPGSILGYSFQPTPTSDLRPMVALTIDDGWDVEAFDEMMLLLKEHNTQATFFLVGMAAKNLGPDRLKVLAKNRHEIGYHSYTHEDLYWTQTWGIREWEIDYWAWHASLANLMGVDFLNVAVPYARAPWGLKSEAFSKMALNHEMTVIGWSVDPYTDPGSERYLKDGDILLLHVRMSDVAVLEEVLANRSFRFVPLSVLLADSNG